MGRIFRFMNHIPLFIINLSYHIIACQPIYNAREYDLNNYSLDVLLT